MSYSQVTVTGYNSSPPSDDGAIDLSNRITWAGIKNKLTDPLKTAIESVDDAVASAITTTDAYPAAWVAADAAVTAAYQAADSILQASIDLKLAASSYTAADVLSKLLTVDGSGSGLDADLLDGLSSAAFARVANNLSDLANAATAFTNIKQAASTTASGVVQLATADEMVTNTDTGRVPSVSVVKNHPGVAKAWGSVTNPSGTAALEASYGVTSVNRSAVGVVDVTLSVTMANDDYVVMATLGEDTDEDRHIIITDRTTTTFQVTIEVSSGNNRDENFMFVVFGNLA